jgi:curved DNA-binding protein CbpA
MIAANHYETLGVLPEAEAIVISAAYRALAQRYHPDKSADDPEKAHRHMSEINEAYRVLGDKKLRAEYDASRRMDEHADYQTADSEESKQAFGAALQELENRWAVAVDIFPDLTALRDSLAKISTSLAFGFVTILLDSKRYNHRAVIASGLERRFLERYFGSNERIIEYAKD